MRIVIAPDSFKGSLTTVQAAEAMAAGLRRVWPDAQIDCVPLADGGEGTVDAWLRARGGRRESRSVTGPLGEPVIAAFGILEDSPWTAIVESASACGLTLVPKVLRNPLLTSTYGVGELIREAAAAIDALADHGLNAMAARTKPTSGLVDADSAAITNSTRVIVGLGGTATNDGGAGALQALGVHFFDAADNLLLTPLTGGTLQQIARIDASDVFNGEASHTAIILASDVMNPYVGPNGASAIYGPQKGANPEMVGVLDGGLAHLAEIIRRDVGPDIAGVAGAGAAGGLGGALMAVFGAKMCSGIELVLDAAGFDVLADGADYVVTGEGSIDRQTLSGKAVMGVVNRCRRLRTPVIAIGGLVDAGTAEILRQSGVVGVEAAALTGMPLDEAMRRAADLVEDAAARIAATVRVTDEVHMETPVSIAAI